MTALTNLTDVTITSLQPGDLLQSPDGATWINIQPGVGSGIQPYNASTSFFNVAETRSASIDMAGNIILRPQLKNYSETVVTVVAAATTTLDIANGNIFNMSQAANITTFNFNNPAATGRSCAFTLIRTKDNSGTSRTIVWPASVKWMDGVTPTVTQTANAIDTLEFFTIDGGTIWYGFQSGLNML